MTKTWKNKVLDYYNTFKSMSSYDASNKFGHSSDDKDEFAKPLYHIYDSITTKCPFTETDGMCSWCWYFYHNLTEMLEEADYYDGLEKKHVDYLMKLTKEGVDNDNI